jgi:BolA protein
MKEKGPIETLIQQKLSDAFSDASFLDIRNESFKHSRGEESHFNITVVSNVFLGKSPIERHRMLYKVLGDELKNKIHALSIQAKTIEQWQLNPELNKSPNCVGSKLIDAK